MKRLPRLVVKYPLYPEDFKPVDDFAREYGATLHKRGCYAEAPPRALPPGIKYHKRFVRAYRIAPEDAPALDAFVIALAKARAVDEP